MDMNNMVTISGVISTPIKFSHRVCDEAFYEFTLASMRLSGRYDCIPAMISERLIDVSQDMAGKKMKINGQFRSYNFSDENGNHLKLHVFVKEAKIIDSDSKDENKILLEGTICRTPRYKETALGREITDMMLAVKRQYRKTDYIPCICWNRNALFADTLEPGTTIRAEGRIQSREYIKKFSEDKCETRIAYEVSIRNLEVTADAEEEED